MDIRVKKALTICAGTIVVLIVVLFAMRGVILRTYVKGRVAAIERNYPVSVRYSGLSMDGLAAVRINDLSLQQIGADTLFKIREVSVGVSPLRLLLMQLRVTRMDMDGLHMQFIKRDSCSNYDFIYKNLSQVDSIDLSQVVAKTDFSRKVDRVCKFVFGLIPLRALMTDTKVTYIHNDYRLAIAVDRLDIKDKRFSTRIDVTEADSCHKWIGEGEILDNNNNVYLKLYPQSEPKITLPFLAHRLGAEVSFDTLSFNLVQQRVGHGVTEVSGRASVDGLSVRHNGLSPNAVLLDRGKFDYKINVGSNFVELDSATVVQFNQIEFSPYVLAERGDNWHFRVCVDKERFPADALFSSLPRGLFLNLEGIKTEGELSYHLLFDVDLGQVDSLKLESQLKKYQFKIKQFGNTDLRRMNSSFVYTAYERGEPLRSFEVGDANPNFRPLNQISPLLQMTVMQSEDGAFFHHNGFLLDCLRDALINDIKRRSFARGGSTISMQLVKNVFLSRHKTIARKTEEALIVWLIEENRLTSKERMFEVYMNIIEWGPLVYGANEAARFYFDKDASQLDLNESIFLASIIPSPKRALNAFDENIQLKPYFEGSYRILGERLVVKGLITEEQAAELRAEVTLRGEAKQMIVERGLQQAVSDSLSINNTELLK